LNGPDAINPSTKGGEAKPREALAFPVVPREPPLNRRMAGGGSSGEFEFKLYWVEFLEGNHY